MARMREPLRRAMWEAARRGDRLVDLNLLADAGIPAVFEVFGTLLQKSEEAAERGFLLTGPPGGGGRLAAVAASGARGPDRW